jgi:hypothetical protein
MFCFEHVSSLLSMYGFYRATYLEVANNRLESVATSSDHFLHDVTKIVDQEVQCLSILCDGSELCVVSGGFLRQSPRATYESIYCANDLANQVCHVTDQTDEKRVEIQRVENASDNLNEVAESHNKFEVDIDIGNGDVDLLHRNLNTSIDLHKACNLGMKIQIGLQLRYDELDSSNVQFRNLEENIGRTVCRHGGRCGCNCAIAPWRDSGACRWSSRACSRLRKDKRSECEESADEQ